MDSNPKDPLLRTGPEATIELMRRLVKVCGDGFSPSQVVEASCNLIINAIRQSHPTRQGAERTFDEIFGKAKSILLEQHYDTAGRKRGIFPHNQTIIAPRHLEPRG
jgi:hypothetical protein